MSKTGFPRDSGQEFEDSVLITDLSEIPLQRNRREQIETYTNLLEEKRKEIARARDARRRQIQAEQKKRKAENAAKAAAKAAKEARPMSARKRRYLEDKKK